MNTIEKAMQRLAINTPPPQAPVSPPSPDPVVAAPASDNARPLDEQDEGIFFNTKDSIEIDHEYLRNHGMLIPDDKRSRIKEEYRHIKRPLLVNAAGKGATVIDNGNLIMVTSASPGEGKTFTAMNLALSIAAERDRTVLLVDADVVRPSLSKFFGVAEKPGLVDYLVNEDTDLADVLIGTGIPSLTLLPAGYTHHLSTELLGSRNMAQLTQMLSQRFPDRIVIFDSPPLLMTTEARVVAGLVGQLVMVVEAQKTLQSQVKDALALLDPDPNRVVGFVLNKTQTILGSYYYGYSYYGYYGYYGKK